MVGKRFWSAVVGAGVLVLVAAAPASAANPACGATVTHDVKLTSDMDCSASNTAGMVVGKKGLTIDLNGHTLTGPGVAGNYVGIDNSDGFDNVTVKNGTVKNYYEGINISYSAGSKVVKVKAIDQAASYGAIDFWYSRDGLIDRSTASGPGDYGFYLYENDHVNLTNSKVAAPDNSSTYGIYDYESRSTVSGNASNGGYYGMYLEEPYPGYKVTGNTFNGNSDSGLYVYDNYPAALYDANVSNNTANGNGSYGFYAELSVKGKKNHAKNNGTSPQCFHVKCN